MSEGLPMGARRDVTKKYACDYVKVSKANGLIAGRAGVSDQLDQGPARRAIR
jgi:hypothetical protein